jgi:thioredoxin 1
MMKKEESAMMQKSGTYTTYSANSLALAQKERTVLFFHAGWCPTCRTADADITAGVATIPAGVTILKTDYDKEVALKQKYGVTSQHTFVEVDANGTMIQKWSGGNLAGIIAKL